MAGACCKRSEKPLVAAGQFWDANTSAGLAAMCDSTYTPATTVHLQWRRENQLSGHQFPHPFHMAELAHARHAVRCALCTAPEGESAAQAPAQRSPLRRSRKHTGAAATSPSPAARASPP